MKIILRIRDLFLIFFSKYYFSFIDNYNYLKLKPKNYLFKKFNENSENDTLKFENLLCNHLGGGFAKNFASARMALYIILKTLNLKEDDNICVTAFTCSAVINAIKRLNLNIKYIDIDKKNYGTSYDDLILKVDNKTRVVLAQHTFGFSCEIFKIKEFCQKQNIILIEDCALTFGSKKNNSTLGTFGDYSIFSFDQTKPFSTFIGGCVYTKNIIYFEKLIDITKDVKDIDHFMQKAILKRIIYNARFNVPILSSKLIFLDLIINILIRKGFLQNPYLDSDFLNSFEARYPYPARYPNFLSSIGILCLDNFNKVSKMRKNNIKFYIKRFSKYPTVIEINKNYFNNLENIETNRFIILHPKGKKIRNKLSSFIRSNLMWFKKPIEAGYDDLSKYGYTIGDCKNAEDISEKIINLPLDINRKQVEYISNKFINICVNL